MGRILISEGGVTRSEIVIGRALLDSGPGGGPPVEAGRRVAVLAQPSTASIARSMARGIRAAGGRAEVRVLPDRDAAKSLGVVEDCYLWLNDVGFRRGDLVLAVGGGALTDVAGFIAATYLRGVEAVYVPTTLLGAVDAAIGGKTGVNVGGKNLAGVFRHPSQIIIDLDVLDALPVEVKREGAAEAVKAGFIGDLSLVELFERDGLAAPLDEVVERAVAVKAGIVSQDFEESDLRAVLNYGHTVGHAIEIAGGIPHGHAIAIGMVAAGFLSEAELGFEGAVRQRGLLELLGLPVQSPPVDPAAVRRLMDLDKKADEQGLRFVLLEHFSRPVVRRVAPATVDAALAAVGIR